MPQQQSSSSTHEQLLNDAPLEDIFPNQEQTQDNETFQEQTQDSETPQEQNEDLQSSSKKRTRTTWEVDVFRLDVTLQIDICLMQKKIRNEMDQGSSSQSQSVSQDDPLGKAFGKEHPGRVCGLGFGPCPSKVFNNTSSSSNDNQMKEYVSNLEKELVATKAQLQAQNDMQKAMGGALVAVLEKTFGKVPE
nr:uncharacterized protein LOC109154559 [Ipomoea trifida]